MILNLRISLWTSTETLDYIESFVRKTLILPVLSGGQTMHRLFVRLIVCYLYSLSLWLTLKKKMYATFLFWFSMRTCYFDQSRSLNVANGRLLIWVGWVYYDKEEISVQLRKRRDNKHCVEIKIWIFVFTSDIISHYRR